MLMTFFLFRSVVFLLPMSTTASCTFPSHLPTQPWPFLPWTTILEKYVNGAVKIRLWSTQVKTKVLIFGVPQLLQRLPLFKLKLFNKQISTETVAKDLGVQLDANLIYNEHIIKCVSNCLFKLKQINRIKHLLDRKTLSLLMNAFVFNKLLYCSSVWSNTSNSNIDKLQKVQNLLDESFWDLENMTIFPKDHWQKYWTRWRARLRISPMMASK